jgi:YfiH family protein
MAGREEEPLITIPRWNQVGFLVHGFGRKGWTAADLMSRFPGYVMVTTKQVHSDKVNFIESVPGSRPVGDGLATDQPGLLLVVKTADCLPILLADPERRVVAALHCGWRGTVERLAEKAVAALAARYGAEPAGLLAAFGPCVQKPCYEVGEDVKSRFEAAGLPLDDLEPHPSKEGKYLLDLQGANRFQLLRAGLEPGRMNFVGDCTHCQPSLSSFRREKEKAGRMLSFVGLKSGLSSSGTG